MGPARSVGAARTLPGLPSCPYCRRSIYPDARACRFAPHAITSATTQPISVQPSSRLTMNTPPGLWLRGMARIAGSSEADAPAVSSDSRVAARLWLTSHVLTEGARHGVRLPPS